VNFTKFAPLVLGFIVALAVVSSVSLTFSFSMSQPMEATLSKGDNDVNRFTDVLTQGSRVLGDPINDPIPNAK